jgi:hypothetical protein
MPNLFKGVKRIFHCFLHLSSDSYKNYLEAVRLIKLGALETRLCLGVGGGGGVVKEFLSVIYTFVV